MRLDRRTFIVLAAAYFASACGRRPDTSTATPALGDMRECLDAITERIIPATDTPGARDANVAGFIEFALENAFTDRQSGYFTKALEELNGKAVDRFGKTFSRLTPDRQDLLLQELQTEAADHQPPGEAFFNIVKTLTVIGYYTSEIGATRELRYLAVPGHFASCTPLSTSERALFFGSGPDALL